jgi:hypothetical protein
MGDGECRIVIVRPTNEGKNKQNEQTNKRMKRRIRIRIPAHVLIIVRVQLLRHRLSRVLQLLKERRADREEVDTGKGLDLANVTEGGTHDDGLVAVLLVVVEDALDRLDTRVLLADIVRARLVLLVPVEDLEESWRLVIQFQRRDSTRLLTRSKNGEIRAMPASAHATACSNPNRRVRLQWMPSHVLAILMRTRFFLTPTES